MYRSLLLLPILAACNESAAERMPAPAAKPITAPLATAIEAPTPDILSLTGKVVADQRADVTADTQGKVLAVMVERGQRVRRGDPVVKLDVRGAALSTREASANLESARTEQKLAQRECERTQRLLDDGAITRSEWDRQSARCTSAVQQVSAASARTALLAKSVDDGIVRAPFDGIVTERAVTAGEWVAPGRSLFTLVDASPLLVEVSVSEANFAAIAEGQHVEVTTVSRRGKRYGAKVTRVGAEIGRSRSLIVEATLEATSELVPGMFVSAAITTGHTRRPVIPASAVARRGRVWHAFVVDKAGVVTDRIVQLGSAPATGQVSILQNVAAGERVVATITPQIADGLRVAE
jgi:membrane fusion protein (multidrug efflux system)